MGEDGVHVRRDERAAPGGVRADLVGAHGVLVDEPRGFAHGEHIFEAEDGVRFDPELTQDLHSTLFAVDEEDEDRQESFGQDPAEAHLHVRERYDIVGDDDGVPLVHRRDRSGERELPVRVLREPETLGLPSEGRGLGHESARERFPGVGDGRHESRVTALEFSQVHRLQAARTLDELSRDDALLRGHVARSAGPLAVVRRSEAQEVGRPLCLRVDRGRTGLVVVVGAAEAFVSARLKPKRPDVRQLFEQAPMHVLHACSFCAVGEAF